MAILFAQYWDVVEGREKQYEEFVVGTYIPAMEKMGMRVVGGYYVLVGAGPDIIGISTTDDLSEFQRLIVSKEYAAVLEQLFPLVRDYASRLLVSYGPIEVKRYDVQLGVLKFNHYFNIIPGTEARFKEFLEQEFTPGMAHLGMTITNVWKVAIGTGPFILIETSSPGFVEIARATDTNEYRALMRTMRTKYIMDYQSRVLAPTRRVEFPHFIKGLTMGL